MRSSRLFALAAAVALLGAASTAGAQEGYQPPVIELGLGATNMSATAGNGRLTTGVSHDGDISVLSWPSPSFYDQLHYITSNASDAREQPRFGAPKRVGAFAGLVLHPSGGGDPETTWLRKWDREVTYLQDDVRVVQTTFEDSERGLTVVQYDFVAQERDVLVRQYEVTKDASAEYDAIELLNYTNLTTNLSKVPQLPLVGVMMDHKNGFAGLWNSDEEALVQFHPNDTGVVRTLSGLLGAAGSGPLGREFGPLGDLMTSETLDTTQLNDIAGRLDEEYAKGVYAAVSTTPGPSGYQVGEDETDFCSALDSFIDNAVSLGERRPDADLPVDAGAAEAVRCGDYDPVETVRDAEGWKYSAEDAFTDAQDGELNGNPLAGGQVNAAMTTPIEFGDGESTATASQYIAFGETNQAALDTLNWAKGEGATAIRDAVVSNDEAFIEDLWFPEELEGDLLKFVKRAFLNLKVGTDRETGAIMASISRQPSYQLDWPRDGAFFNTALDLSGQHELVSQRMDFYSDAMRKEAKEPSQFLNNPVPGWPDNTSATSYPPNSWEMNYYADGEPGGTIRLEIDNTALLIWAYVAHVGHLPEGDRSDYIDQVWPTVEKATNFVADWRDPETGLMWPANEDDHTAFTQGLQGASTSYLALTSAARLAKHRGEDELAEEWARRAGELHAATMHYMGDEEYGFVDYQEGGGGAAGRAWLGWPTRFLPYDNERLREVTREKLNGNLEGVRGNDGNGLYPTKPAISAAMVFDDEETRGKALEIAERLASDIADQQTYTIGETYVTLDENGDGETDDFINAVSTPHLWSASLVYITAVAYYAPERLDPFREVLPEVEIPEVTPPGVDPSGGDAGTGDAGDTGDAAGPADDTGTDVGSDDAGGDDLAVGGGDTTGGGDPGDPCGCGTQPGEPPAGLAFFLVLLALLRRHGRTRRRDSR